MHTKRGRQARGEISQRQRERALWGDKQRREMLAWRPIAEGCISEPRMYAVVDLRKHA